MGDKTGISWTDATWNPVRGCSRVSEGCRNCYAERVAARFSDEGQPYHGLADRSRKGSKWTGVVRLIPEHLADPLRWKKPRRIFVNSMSDLFHEALADDAIDQVFAVMALANQHTYQVLTKRAARMRQYITTPGRHDAWSEHMRKLAPRSPVGGVSDEWWPRFAKHIWLGVSVENQAAADERIPELLKTPAAVRFLSCEPLIGPVQLGEVSLHGKFIECPDEDKGDPLDPCAGCPGIPNDGKRGGEYCGAVRGPHIDWVIAGCESGPGARPCSVEWLRSLRDQCADAGAAFFLKQAAASHDGERANHVEVGQLVLTHGVGSKRKSAGVIELPYLDGEQWAQFPEVSP